MKANRAILTVVVVLVLVIAGWWLFRRGSAAHSIDLLGAVRIGEEAAGAGPFTRRPTRT